MNNILTVRQRMILGILNSRPESIKGREIAGILGVTDRTVRSDIQILEDFLKEYDVSIEAVRGKGYRLIGKSQILLQQLVYRQNGLLSQDDRIREILWTLLDSLDPIPLGELEDELYVSRSTLEQDLRWISFHYEKISLISVSCVRTVPFLWRQMNGNADIF
ncbi:HTH domain-containing protein [Ruminococcus sp. AM58-7XD]|nr:HTH domain-containing protein [Ruminococcus sp. AM58-7XD]